jgi:hypothetical protein
MDWCNVYLTPQGLPKYMYLSPPLIFPTTHNGIRTKNRPVWITPGAAPIRWMGPIRNHRWEQKRTEGYVIVFLWVRAAVLSNKEYTIGICCFSARNASLRRKSKDWLARNQNNVSEWSDISTQWLLLAHLAKGNVSCCHHLAPVVRRLSSVYFSHFNLLLRNASAKWSET